MIDKEHL